MASARDWYLRDWLAHFGKRQANLVNELGWDKARASFVYNGRQGYRREIVNEVASWLGLEPFELLMPPADAIAWRTYREAVRRAALQEPYPMAAEPNRPFVGPGAENEAKPLGKV